jgi:hypothetical protein
MMARDRDRDAAGRARNARPRDAFGRPLARGEAGETPVPDDLSLPAAEALALAQRLLDSGRPFQAHEVLEATWKSAPGAERDLWQGLAQVAVGLTHAQRGNARGAVALLRRGAARVSAFLPGGEEGSGARDGGADPQDDGGADPEDGGGAGPQDGGGGGLGGGRRGGPEGRTGGPEGGRTGSRASGSEAAGSLHGIDVPAVIRAADELATRIERDGLDPVAPADLQFRLRAADG